VRKFVLTTILAAGLVATAPLPASARVVGSDVASWQHPHHSAIAWHAVRAQGHRFVFIKATEGTGYINPYFRRDWRGTVRAKIYRGAYHFARPSRNLHSAVAQAHRFVHVAGRAHARGDLPPTLDLEATGGLRPARLIAWTRTWLRTVTHLTGRRPMIYSYHQFWSHAMHHTRAFRHYRLWGASYTRAPTTFGRAWSQWTFWQFTARGHVHGIRGHADVNVFHGSLHRLQAMANIRSHTARRHHRVKRH
jgi:GH25 family lysozyme M1 (1,4-beta-N-acetylmuramidase)